ncbi:S-layer homology domain-containing protein, partial [Streptomyces sp. ISID311]|uniref:S-layer homology domain-containing protein n=1 Tax=Streptomyces sp. ISID311 TaxID=2601673 RepID=UPI0011BD3B4F
GNTTNEDKSKEGVFRKFRNVSNVLGAYRPSYPSDEEKPGAWARDACEWAMDSGIIRGYGNGVYGWGSYITREEMAVMLSRFYELDKE